MAVTYYVALPFVPTEVGVAPGQAQEMPNETAAIRRAESMSRDPSQCRRAGVQAERRPEHGKFRRSHNSKNVRRGGREFGRTINIAAGHPAPVPNGRKWTV